jgi:hypothetical protein
VDLVDHLMNRITQIGRRTVIWHASGSAMSDSSDEVRWRDAVGKLGPEIARLKEEPRDAAAEISAVKTGESQSERFVDTWLHDEELADRSESAKLHPVRYWLIIAAGAGLIAAVTGLMALLPMSMR